MTGAVLFSSIVLLPQLLQRLMGYSAESAGVALSAGGLVLMVGMPIVGQITSRIAARYVIAFGWLLLIVDMRCSRAAASTRAGSIVGASSPKASRRAVVASVLIKRGMPPLSA